MTETYDPSRFHALAAPKAICFYPLYIYHLSYHHLDLFTYNHEGSVQPVPRGMPRTVTTPRRTFLPGKHHDLHRHSGRDFFSSALVPTVLLALAWASGHRLCHFPSSVPMYLYDYYEHGRLASFWPPPQQLEVDGGERVLETIFCAGTHSHPQPGPLRIRFLPSLDHKLRVRRVSHFLLVFLWGRLPISHLEHIRRDRSAELGVPCDGTRVQPRLWLGLAVPGCSPQVPLVLSHAVPRSSRAVPKARPDAACF